MLGSAFGDRRTVFSSRFSSALMRFTCLSPRGKTHRLQRPDPHLLVFMCALMEACMPFHTLIDSLCQGAFQVFL